MRSDPIYDEVAQAGAAAVIRGYSTSFGWACRLLREPVRRHVRNVYAFVRLADEIVDGPLSVHGDRCREALDDLEADAVRAVLTGYSTNLVVHAFALTARRYALDPQYLRDFFVSMRTDLTATRHTSASLDRYVYGSAEVVGLMCLDIFLRAEGRSDGAALAPGAQALAAAFQKINFLRDLAADRDRLGRVYLPVDPEHVTDVQRDVLLAEIRDELDRAAAAIVRLPASSRTAVAATHRLFAELARRLGETPAPDLVRVRVRVPTVTKVRILAAAVLTGGRV